MNSKDSQLVAAMALIQSHLGITGQSGGDALDEVVAGHLRYTLEGLKQFLDHPDHAVFHEDPKINRRLLTRRIDAFHLVIDYYSPASPG